MLKKLRWQLSLLYVLAAAVLIVLIGGGAYGLLSYYFQSSTDLVLQYKVALEFARQGQSVPADLQPADEAWQTRHKLTPAPRATEPLEDESEDETPQPSVVTGQPGYATEDAARLTATPTAEGALPSVEPTEQDGEEEEDSIQPSVTPMPTAASETPPAPGPSAVLQKRNSAGNKDAAQPAMATPVPTATLPAVAAGEEAYDSELAAVFLLPVDANGQVISLAGNPPAPFQPNLEAVNAALINGSDFRTVRLEDDSRMRLFTYRVNQDDRQTVYQVGRSLKDQDHALQQLLLGLGLLGSASLLGVGAASWWLAGRALIPAQQAWDRQQTFVGNASHELRAPLTLLRASAEVARRGLSAQEPRYELLGDVLSETDHMSALVDDLLLLSRLDDGRMKLELQPVQAADLLNDLAREMGRVAAGRGVTLDVPRAAGSALADPVRLRQVLLILLDNALRHTPAEGAIHMEAWVEKHQAHFLVSDSGSGIPARHLPHVFERFYRGEEDRSQRPGGSGLGLAIARGLAEAMHGQISLASQEGRGTRVTLTLPAGG